MYSYIGNIGMFVVLFHAAACRAALASGHTPLNYSRDLQSYYSSTEVLAALLPERIFLQPGPMRARRFETPADSPVCRGFFMR